MTEYNVSIISEVWQKLVDSLEETSDYKKEWQDAINYHTGMYGHNTYVRVPCYIALIDEHLRKKHILRPVQKLMELVEIVFSINYWAKNNCYDYEAIEGIIRLAGVDGLLALCLNHK